MSSSSEDDSDRDRRKRLLEAVDPGHQQIFDRRKEDNGKNKNKKDRGGSYGVSSTNNPPPPSNRRDKNEASSNASSSFHSELKVTPEFRVFVAKKLAESIDRNVKEKRLKFSFDKEGKGEETPLDNPGLGVHLFSDSSACLQLEEPESQQNLKKRQKPDLLAHRKNQGKKAKREKTKKLSEHKGASSSSSSSEESESELKSVAVSSEWVLGQKGVY